MRRALLVLAGACGGKHPAPPAMLQVTDARPIATLHVTYDGTPLDLQ